MPLSKIVHLKTQGHTMPDCRLGLWFNNGRQTYGQSETASMS